MRSKYDRPSLYCQLTVPCTCCKSSRIAGNKPYHAWLGKGRHTRVDQTLSQVKLLNSCGLNSSYALPFHLNRLLHFPLLEVITLITKACGREPHACLSASGTNLAQTHLQWQLIARHQTPCRSSQDAETLLGQLCHRAQLIHQNLHLHLKLLQHNLPEPKDFPCSHYQRRVSV